MDKVELSLELYNELYDFKKNIEEGKIYTEINLDWIGSKFVFYTEKESIKEIGEWGNLVNKQFNELKLDMAKLDVSLNKRIKNTSILDIIKIKLSK